MKANEHYKMADTEFVLFFKTGAICLAFFAIGLVSSIIGPTILDLQCVLKVSYDDVIKILPVRSTGHAIGSVAVGFLYDHFNPLLTLAVTIATMGICTILTPLVTSLVSMSTISFLCATCIGIIDPSCSLFLLHIWGKASQPYLLTIHFFFGLGGLVAPLLASPFLAPEGAPIDGRDSNMTYATASHCYGQDSSIYIPYAILGVSCLVVALVFFYLLYYHRHTQEHPSRHATAGDAEAVNKEPNLWHKGLVVSVAAMFLLTLVSFEIGMAGFIASFAVMSDHHLTTQVGAYMTSLYWLTYTSFRLLSIPLINKIGVYRNITMELGILVISNIFLVPFGDSTEWCLWVGVALVGIGISTTCASVFVLLESYFPVTSGIASGLTVSACIGGWIYPIIMGYALEVNPQLFLWCAVGVEYADIIKILPAKSSGYALGSFMVGIFHERMNPIVTITVCLTTLGTFAILLPWANSLITLLITAFLCTIGGGMIDNTSNVLMLYMWGKESQPYMQALHFSFGLGSLVVPLVVSPFLTAGEVPIEGLESNVTNLGLECRPEELRIRTPYAILGCYSLTVALAFLYLSCYHRQTDAHPSRLAKTDDSVGGVKRDLVWSKRIAILLAGMFLFTLLGFEIGMGSFITSFAVMSDHHLSKQVGAYMTSLYFGTYTFFRLFAIGFVGRMSIFVNITGELCILVIANFFLVPFGNSVEWCLWVGVALAGMGISTIWAAIFSLLESRFPVTSGVASFLSVCTCLGAWVYPVIMGYAVEAHPQMFLYTIAGCTVLCCTLFGLLSFVCKTRFSPRDEKEPVKDNETQ
ncbi:Major facilitator superfamily domain-containing protein 4A [Halotydeus destructor]|nr:Major facilitator superfamily domain-containing protein 4A [Halotydeus destructor]